MGKPKRVVIKIENDKGELDTLVDCVPTKFDCNQTNDYQQENFPDGSSSRLVYTGSTLSLRMEWWKE